MRVAMLGVAVVSFALASACAGDTATAPIDGGRCVAGALEAGTAASGRLDASSCQRWSPRSRDVVASDSWTLEADSNTLYIVRMIPTDTLPGATTLRARISAYALGANGELQLAGSEFFRFGPNQRGTEMFFPTQAASRYWVRVEGQRMADSGAYRVEVERCPIHFVRLGTTSVGLTPSAQCIAYSLRNGARSAVRYAAFDPPELGSYDVRLRRTAGAASFAAYYAGYGTDVAAQFEGAFVLGTGPRTDGQYTYRRPLTRRGRVGLILNVHADSVAAVDVDITSTPALRGPTTF